MPSATSSRSVRPSSSGDILFVGARGCQGPPDEDRVLHGRGGPGGAAGRPSRSIEPHPRVADLHEAPLDLCGGAADAASPDGRLHTTFHQAVAATGRLSSSNPNLQNIPIRTDLGRRIRRAFVSGAPAPVLLAADYSPDRAPDPRPCVRRRAPQGGVRARGRHPPRDRGARAPQGPADVTADERSMAKMVNFGLAYGMRDFGLSAAPGSAARRRRSSSTRTSRRTPGSATT